MSERQPLLRSGSSIMKQGYLSRRTLWGPIDPRRGDLALFACCYVTGLLDAAAFNNWGLFIGMQTGNTVILCLSSAGYPESQKYAWASTTIVLVTFFIGGVITTHLSNHFGALRRGVLTSNFLFQAILIILAAALTSSDLVPTDSDGTHTVFDNPRILTALPPLGFQAGATIATSRLLGYGQVIPVNVVTSTYAALAADPKLLALHNVPRNQRVIACLSVAAGALSGAWIQRRSAGVVACLWLAAAIKLAVAFGVALFLEPAPKSEDE